MVKETIKVYKKRYKTNKIGHKIRNKKTIKFKKLNCSITVKNKKFTCYSDTELYKLRDIWNARHPDRPIKTTKTKHIWDKLKEYYANICNKESCWVRQMVKNTKLEKDLLEAFAPESPKDWEKNPNEWLSSIDIIKVMNKYEKEYKCFNFLGPSPIDYDTHEINNTCVWEELCHFKLSQHIKEGYHKIGVIFNLDPHYKGGSHWVSLFINVKKKTIFFFDSAGEPIPKQIQNFVNTVIAQGNTLSTPINFKFDQNYPVEHQYENTECGVYSLFFIIYMLQDKINSHYLKTHIIKDKYMEHFRNIFYNKNGDI